MIDSDDEDYECPLCMEELDIADRNFRPCTCGYQICRFCWHHIKENLNGRCPACRRVYSDQMVEFQPISSEEISRIKREKKEKERQQKDMEAANRRHLANMRVVQKNLVYVIGLHPKLASEEIVRSNDLFGQFGKISKIVINKRPVAPTSNASGTTTMQPSAAVYVTYFRKEDAAKAIAGVDGSVMAGRILRASYGTTKYCTYYLRNMTCPNPTCLYLHEPGEDADTISKEELATGKHRMRDQMSTDAEHRGPSHSSSASSDMPSRKPATLESVATISYKNASARPDLRQYSSYSHPTPTTTTTSTPVNDADDDRPALPATASWAKPGSGPSTPTLKSDTLPERALTPDNFGPPLAVAVAAAQKQNQQQQQAATPKRKSEKKKRKEMQKSESSASSSRPGTPSSVVPPSELELHAPEPKIPEYYDGLIHFVLGDALLDVCSLADCHADLDEEPVGVSALHDDTDSLVDGSIGGGEGGPDLLAEPVMTPLEFLTDAAPSRDYAGSFNPFAHQFLRSTGNLFEAPIRKCSRFGFAQI